MPKPVKIKVVYDDGTSGDFIPEVTGVAPPPPVVKSTNIGINLEQVSYWMASRPFNDLAKQIQPWVSSKIGGTWGSGGALTLNADGYILTIPSGCVAMTQVQTSRSVPKGTYRLQPSGSLTPSIFNKTADEQTCLISVNKPISSISFTGTETELFSAPFVSRLNNYNTIRFMDWGRTNVDRAISWESRVTPASYTQGEREVALEYQIELCKKTNSAMWQCIHHKADDNYVRECAKLIKANWNGLPIYLEHSNEVWNGGFPAYQYCLSRSTATNHPLEYHIKRTAQIAQIFRSEGVNVISVLGLQSAAANVSEWLINKVSGLPKDIDAIAIAPYFGGRNRISAGAIASGIDGVLSDCSADIDRIRTEIVANVALANKYGKKLLGYEGGQHLVPNVSEHTNTALIDLFITCNRSPRMYDLYRKYLSIWDEITGKALICLFNDTVKPSKHGCWGLQEWDGQPLSEAHKLRAVLDHIKG